MAQEKTPQYDGSLYASGATLIIRPRKTQTGITLGGSIAECQDEETATELARVFNSHGSLVEALKQIRDLPIPEQDNMLAANMREIARAALALAKG
jgi:hypothetical protein